MRSASGVEKVAGLVGLVVSEGADFVRPEALPEVVSTRRRHDIDWQDVVRRLEQGEGTHAIGKSLGVSRGYLCGRLVDMGLPCSVTEARKRAGLPPLDDRTLHGHGRGGNKKKSIDLEAAVRLLESGMSLSEVAPEVGVSSVTLHKRLVEAGLPTSAKAARQRAGLPVIEREVRHVELKPKPMTTSKPMAEPAAKPAPPPAPQPVFAPSVPARPRHRSQAEASQAEDRPRRRHGRLLRPRWPSDEGSCRACRRPKVTVWEQIR